MGESIIDAGIDVHKNTKSQLLFFLIKTILKKLPGIIRNQGDIIFVPFIQQEHNHREVSV